MNTFLKAMILPMAASALFTGTAANAQVLSPNPVISQDKDRADIFGNSNGAPIILVDDDGDDESDGYRKHGKRKFHFMGDDDDHEDEDEDDDDDDDDDDNQSGTNAGSSQMNGPVPDNGLFNNGSKPTVEVQ